MSDRISKAHRIRIVEYIEYLQPTLWLQEWQIHLNDDPPRDETSSASINTRRGQKVSSLWLGDKFFDDEIIPDELRTQILIHEMIHLHLENGWNFADSVFENELGNQARGMAENVFKFHMEFGIDQLAYAISDLVKPFKLND